MTVERWQRAAATNPGKHGIKDWRVTFNGAAPTHSELLFMLGMALIAEDRYPSRPGALSDRYRLWFYVDLLTSAKTPAAVIDVADSAQSDIESSQARMATR